MDNLESRPRRRRVWLWPAIGAAVLVVGIGATVTLRSARGEGPASQKKKKSDKDAPAASPVELTRVGRDAISTFLETTSTLEPRNEATLVARRQGQVVALGAEEGQWVQRGQPLARLDEIEAKLAFTRAELASEVAKRDLERGKQLKERGMVSVKELDDLELKMRSAWQELEQARYDLGQTRIVAPFSGRVVERMVNLGETVTPGKECFKLADMRPLLARVYFPERELARVRPGQTATLQVETLPGQQFPARVSIVNPTVDRANGTFKVTLEVQDRTGMLRPGNFARVKLRTGTFDRAIVLARRAIVSEDGDDFVFRARADSVSRVRVHVGAISGDTVQVLAGLVEGDSVVTVGQGGLKQGSKIKPVRF